MSTAGAGPLSILHVFRAPVGGLFRHVLDLVRGQAAAGHRVGVVADVVNSGQFASRKACDPPQSCVRQTLNDPWKMVFPLAGFGSAITGG